LTTADAGKSLNPSDVVPCGVLIQTPGMAIAPGRSAYLETSEQPAGPFFLLGLPVAVYLFSLLRFPYGHWTDALPHRFALRGLCMDLGWTAWGCVALGLIGLWMTGTGGIRTVATEGRLVRTRWPMLFLRKVWQADAIEFIAAKAEERYRQRNGVSQRYTVYAIVVRPFEGGDVFLAHGGGDLARAAQLAAPLARDAGVPAKLIYLDGTVKSIGTTDMESIDVGLSGGMRAWYIISGVLGAAILAATVLVQLNVDKLGLHRIDTCLPPDAILRLLGGGPM